MKLRNLIASAVIAMVPLAANVTTSALSLAGNTGSTGCSVVELAPLHGAFTVQGNVASTTIDVKGPSYCRETVSLASWNTAYGSNDFFPSSTQRFVTGVTYTNLHPGRHTLSVNVNSSCNFQADIVRGSNQKSAAGDAHYSPSLLLGATKEYTGVCEAPVAATTETPATPTTAPSTTTNTTYNICNGDTTNVNDGVAAQGGDCSTPTTTVTQTTTSTPTPTPTTTATPAPTVTTASAPVAAQPAALVNTGPGNVIALFAVATFGGYFLRRMAIKKALLG